MVWFRLVTYSSHHAAVGSFCSHLSKVGCLAFALLPPTSSTSVLAPVPAPVRGFVSATPSLFEPPLVMLSVHSAHLRLGGPSGVPVPSLLPNRTLVLQPICGLEGAVLGSRSGLHPLRTGSQLRLLCPFLSPLFAVPLPAFSRVSSRGVLPSPCVLWGKVPVRLAWDPIRTRCPVILDSRQECKG